MSLLLLPVYTRYLSPADYGVTNVVGALVPVLSILFALSLRSSITRLYFKYRDNEPDKVPQIWGAGLLLVLLNTLLLASVFFLIAWLLDSQIFKNIAFYPYIALGIFTAGFQAIFELYQSSLQARQLSIQYSTQNFVLFLLQLIISITLVVVFHWGALGVLLATTAATFTLFVFSLIRFLPEVKLNLKGNIVKEILGYSLPLVPHALAGWASGMINRLFINNIVGTSAAGLFSIGFQFGNLINILSTSVNQAFQPWFFECIESKRDRRDEVIRAANTLILGFTFMALSLSLLSSSIIKFMTDSRYHDAWTIVPIISFAYTFNALYFIASGVIFIEKVKLMPLITITSSSIGVLANWVLIRSFGLIGAAYATLLTFVISSLLATVVGARVYRIGFQWWRLYGTIIIGMLITYGVLVFNRLWINISTIIVLSVVLIFIERKSILGILKKLKIEKSILLVSFYSSNYHLKIKKKDLIEVERFTNLPLTQKEDIINNIFNNHENI